MSQYPYGPPPTWAQQPQNIQPPHWAPQPLNQQYNPYHHQPFIPPPPRPPQQAPSQQGPPGWYTQSLQPPVVPRPGWTDPYGTQHQAPLPQATPDDPTTKRSNKWPKLSIILGADTTLARFKVSGNKPSQEIYASTYYLYRNVAANATPTNYMRIFSKQFPWSIEIRTQQDITCADVWNVIWAELQQPMTDSEWGMLCANGDAGQKHVKEILKANKKRLELNTYADKRILRCDYLGECVWFLGLERDEEFQSGRLLPGWEHAKKPVPEDTWLVKMGK